MDKQLFPQLVGVNLQFISSTVVPNIGNPAVEELVKAVLAKLADTTYLLTDENPANKEQVKELWASFTSDKSVVAAFEAIYLDAIKRVENESLKEGLVVLAQPLVQTLVVATDNVKPDSKQIEDVWSKFIKSEGFVTFLFKNLEFILTRLNLPQWLIDLVKRFIK